MNTDEKVCPRCAETVKAAASICRFCGNEFGGTYQPSRSERRQAQSEKLATQRASASGGAGRAVGIGCLALLGLAFLGSIVGGGSTSTSTSAETDNVVLADNAATVVTENTPATPATPTTDWAISSQQDEMRGKQVHYAEVVSENEQEFEFPYGGGSRLTMTVRRHPKYGDDVYFQISSGQFVCRLDSCSGSINYGSGAERISLGEPDDYDSKTLFASNGSAVIGKLKHAEKVIVELPFYQEGNRQFSFKTHGLVWPPKG